MTWISLAGKILNKSFLFRRGETGFTLIEMVAALGLIVLLLGLMAPTVMTTLDRIQSDSSVRKMV